jgi:hypothetical protein
LEGEQEGEWNGLTEKMALCFIKLRNKDGILVWSKNTTRGRNTARFGYIAMFWKGKRMRQNGGGPRFGR